MEERVLHANAMFAQNSPSVKMFYRIKEELAIEYAKQERYVLANDNATCVITHVRTICIQKELAFLNNLLKDYFWLREILLMIYDKIFLYIIQAILITYDFIQLGIQLVIVLRSYLSHKLFDLFIMPGNWNLFYRIF